METTRREEEEGRVEEEESSVMVSWGREDFRMIFLVSVGESGMSGRGVRV